MTTRLVHLSDLHLRNEKSWATLKAVGLMVPRYKPKALIVSGDFLDHPDPPVLARVRDTLLNICEKCGDNCQLIVVPGNHDYKEFGLFRRKAANEEFKMIFGDWQKPRLLQIEGGRDLAIFTFDSNTNNPMVNFARGCVGNKEMNRFDEAHAQFLQQAGFEDAYKIAVLHHHPLPIADTEESGHFQTDAYLGLEDAGLFLRKMAKREVDLILHGHKHAPFLARVQVDIDQQTNRELVILAAGSGCRRPGACSFNIIEFNGATVNAVVLESSAGTDFHARAPTPLLSYDRFRDRVYELYVRDENVDRTVQLEAHHYSILEYGDCDRSVERQNVRVKSGREVTTWTVEKKCDHGIYAGFAVKATSSGHSNPTFEEAADSGDGKLTGLIRFAVPLRSEDAAPISFEESYRLFNAFALTKEQRQRMADHEHDEEIIVKIRYPIATLLICLRFPESVETLPSIQTVVHATDPPETQNLTERNWCQQNLHVSKLTQTAILTVAKPLENHCYGLRWQLPSEIPRGRSENVKTAAEAAHVRKQFLRPQTRDDLQPMFDETLAELREACGVGPTEHIELGMMVFDEARNRLRFVAGCIDPRLWDYEMIEGQGIGARAHKLDDALVYVKATVPDVMDYSSKPPPGMDPAEILIAVPVRYPVSGHPRYLVGVVTLSSDFAPSPLLAFYDDNESLQALTAFFSEFFNDRLLPALGLEGLG
jgi:predicted phosphodiesterase